LRGEVQPGISKELTNPAFFFRQKLEAVRYEIGSALQAGATLAKVSSLIAIAGLLNWCPRCGEWQGSGSEGKGPSAPNPNATPPPARLIRSVSESLRNEPTSTKDMPDRRSSSLTANSRILEKYGVHEGRPAKLRYGPQAQGHGRRVDAYTGGYPKPDSRPHAHDADFVRGDGHEIPIFERTVDGTILYESGVSVKFDTDTSVYIWRPQGSNE
jgi:hypothetical protein